jgi:YD repeat-containing protein
LRKIEFERLEDRTLLATSGPRINSVTPTQIQNAVFDHIDVTFNEAIDSTTFTTQDVTITGPSGPVVPTSVSLLSGNTYRVAFPALTVRGIYQATIGPQIADLAGNLMDQNQNGINGEASDAYQASLVDINANAIFTTPTTISETNTTYEGKDLLINGTTVTIDGPHNFDSVQLINGAVLTHLANTATQTHLLNLTVTQQVIVDTTSRIDVSGKGYLPGYTTGNTTQGVATGNAGGSYGGVGGIYGTGSTPNAVYGNYTDPDDWGSGTSVGSLGTGGGLVRIAAGQMVLNGAIRADGAKENGGGGSGGGISIRVASLSGTGAIEASGAMGIFGGGGGGGRVAVSAGDFTGFDVSRITALGGTADYNYPGGPGTVYLRNSSQATGTLIIDAGTGGSGVTPLGLPGQTTVTIPDAVIVRSSGAHVQPDQPGMTFDFQGGLTVTNSASFQADGTLTSEGPVTVSAGGVLKSTGTLLATQTVTLGDGSISGTQLTAAVSVISNGTINLGTGSLTINGQQFLSVNPTATLTLKGNLVGTTQNADLFQPLGTVVLNGSGTSAAPQQLEVMSQELGHVSAGYLNNFAYGTLSVGSGNYVQLVDNAHNSTGTGPEALYVNALIVPSGATLNLNGLHLYVRSAQVNGTITGGSLQRVSAGGPLTFATPTSGTLQSAGELDDWTVFGRANQSFAVIVNTGSSGNPTPLQPSLNFAQVQVVDASGNVLATASDSQSGTNAAILGLTLPADGTYHIKVSAPAAHSASTGSYVVSVYDATIHTATTSINQTTYGQINSPYTEDQWTFSALANQQVQFQLMNAASPSLQFSLTGPNGYAGFTGLNASSGLLTLPASGTYTLGVGGGATGAYAFELVQTVQTSLALGTPYQGVLAGSGQAQLFAVNVPSSELLFVSLQDTSSNDDNEMYIKFGSPPTREDFAFDANGGGPSQSLVVPSAAGGTWYVLVYAASVAAPPTSFTIRADASPVLVTGITPVQYGANAVASLTVDGAGFTSNTSVALVSADNTVVYPASSVTFDTFTQLTASVNLTAVPQGTYSIRVTNGPGASDTLPAAFTVTAAGNGQANFQAHLIVPGSVGRHISSTFYIEYANTGTVAMQAPLLVLESSVAADVPLFTLDKSLVVSGFWTSALPQGYSNTVEILASGKNPGVLEPGESVTVPVYYAGMEQPWNLNESQFQFDLREVTSSAGGGGDTAFLNSLQASLESAGIPSQAVPLILINLENKLVPLGAGFVFNNLGPLFEIGVVSAFVKLLDNEASYLGDLGEDVTDVGQLLGFAVQQVDDALSPVGPTLAAATDVSMSVPGNLSLSFSRVFAESISGRNTLGPLGLRWSTPWQTTAAVASDGTVTIIGAEGARRVFQPDSRTAGAYFSQPGDAGTLTGDGRGGYLLTEADGTATDYNASGAMNYIQDTNGNRITAGYKAGLMTNLMASSGAYITIAYNAAGRISTVSDSEGRVTMYTYDSSNQRLLAVKGFNGQITSYTYDTDSGDFSFSALTSITFPGDTHQYFTYNFDGSLASTSNDGGSQTQSYSYVLGEVSTTDGTGDTSHLYYNEQGLVVKSIDPLGNVTLNAYDGNFNLTSVTNALGQSETYTYNAAGEVTSSTDFLGNTTHFSYSGPFNELASLTDANGNTTRYAYSSAGDLLTTTYANGTSETSTYDPEGNATSFLNANGQPVQYAYNAAGQITTETFSGGSKYTYTYDGFGNLLTATDATGTTTFTYDPTTELLTKVAYPNGTSLTFTYNAAGQRTSMVDQTGFTTNYAYDAAGRLSTLTDGSGNPVVTYTYDANGRLSKKTNGNGPLQHLPVRRGRQHSAPGQRRAGRHGQQPVRLHLQFAGPGDERSDPRRHLDLHLRRRRPAHPRRLRLDELERTQPGPGLQLRRHGQPHHHGHQRRHHGVHDQ